MALPVHGDFAFPMFSFPSREMDQFGFLAAKRDPISVLTVQFGVYPHSGSSPGSPPYGQCANESSRQYRLMLRRGNPQVGRPDQS